MIYAHTFQTLLCRKHLGDICTTNRSSWQFVVFNIFTCSTLNVYSNFVILTYCVTGVRVSKSGKMFLRNMVRLTQDQRYAAVQMLLRGTSQAVIARNFQVRKSTITRLYQRLRQTGTTNDRPRSGRPRVTTRRQDRYMCLSHLRNQFRTAVETAQVTPGTHNNRISADTVRNRL